MQTCILCRSSKKDDLLYGEFLTQNNMTVHTYCLYLTSNLTQGGNDDEGFLGFLHKDILKEVKRISKLKCCYCHKKYANIGCCETRCLRTFHFVCGLEHRAENQFLETYNSFCDKHANKLKDRPSKNETCCICFDSLSDKNKCYDLSTILRAPCCRNGWFHKRCLQTFANTAGYFFKCPLCNDIESFRRGVAYRGIFIPNIDAAWELEPNAFVDLLERPNRCAAMTCRNKRGRTHHSNVNQFVFCTTCGGSAVHEQCLVPNQGCKRTYNCMDCVQLLRKNDSGSESFHSTSIRCSNENSNGNSDEENYVDVCGSDTDTSETFANELHDDPLPNKRQNDINNMNIIKQGRSINKTNDVVSIDEEDALTMVNKKSDTNNNMGEIRNNTGKYNDTDNDDDDVFIFTPGKTSCRRRRIILSDSETASSSITNKHSYQTSDSGSESDDPLEQFSTVASNSQVISNATETSKETCNNELKSSALDISCVARRTRRRSSVAMQKEFIFESNATSDEIDNGSENTITHESKRNTNKKTCKLRNKSNTDDDVQIKLQENLQCNLIDSDSSEKNSDHESSFIARRTKRRSVLRLFSESSEPPKVDDEHQSSNCTIAHNNSCIANRTRQRKSTTLVTPTTSDYETDSTINSNNLLDISCIANRTRKRKSINHKATTIALNSIKEYDNESFDDDIVSQNPSTSSSLSVSNSHSKENSSSESSEDLTSFKYTQRTQRNDLYKPSPVLRKRACRILSTSSSSTDDNPCKVLVTNKKKLIEKRKQINPFLESTFHRYENQILHRAYQNQQEKQKNSRWNRIYD